ncbi:MAG: GpE family phage tail protein [Oligoflexales bacterium]
MELAADLALVFHWSPESIENIEICELAKWHELAKKRLELLNGKI